MCVASRGKLLPAIPTPNPGCTRGSRSCSFLHWLLLGYASFSLQSVPNPQVSSSLTMFLSPLDTIKRKPRLRHLQPGQPVIRPEHDHRLPITTTRLLEHDRVLHNLPHSMRAPLEHDSSPPPAPLRHDREQPPQPPAAGIGRVESDQHAGGKYGRGKEQFWVVEAGRERWEVESQGEGDGGTGGLVRLEVRMGKLSKPPKAVRFGERDMGMDRS